MLKKIFEKYNIDKISKRYIYMGIAGVVLLLVLSLFSSEPEVINEPEAPKDISHYKKETEKELSELINSIEGVFSSKVLITFADNGKKEYLNEEKLNLHNDELNNSSDRESTAVVMRSGGDELPVVVREFFPEINGVAIVVDGMKNKKLDYKILNTVKGALGIELNKINVIINERTD